MTKRTATGSQGMGGGKNGRRVAIIDGCRTPFLRSGTQFQDLDAVDLARYAARELVARTEVDGTEIDEVIFGCVVAPVASPNVAREVVLGIGLPRHIPAFTVNRACASSNTAITTAAEGISSGRLDLVLAGGAECLSDIPILFSRKFAKALVAASKARSLAARIGAFRGIRPRDLAPVPPALAEASTGLSMGESAEKMAKENGISREAQDAFALASHQKAAAAAADGRSSREIVTILLPPKYDLAIAEDNGIRKDSTLEQLAKLRPVFDRKYGSVTAGNSSPLTDGASAVLLASSEKAHALGYEPLGYIRSFAYAALDPFDQLLMGPAYAAPMALDRAGLTLADIDLIEMHEAFAAQVLSTVQAFESETFAREKLGRGQALGSVDPARLNVTGGSIAIGHPFGATGARLTMQVLNELIRRDKQFGLITVCAAGGIGFAMVVERGPLHS